MKRVFLLAVLALVVAGCGVKTADISVRIPGFAGNNVIVMQALGVHETVDDTLARVSDDLFQGRIKVSDANEGLLYFDGYKCSLPMFFEPGMKASLEVGFEKKPMDLIEINTPVYSYEGDNADCTRFSLDLQDWLYGDGQKWMPETISQVDFKTYAKAFRADVDSVMTALGEIRSKAFRNKKAREIENEAAMQLVRWGIFNRSDDADFDRWFSTVNVSDPANLNVAKLYLGHYRAVHPAAPGQNSIAAECEMLKELFTDQDLINTIAGSSITYYLQNAPGVESMQEALQAFEQTSTDTEDIAESHRLFEHYKSMTPGQPAVDFVMEDTDGNLRHLSDLKGKALYIDVWATWCGPCCAEIPYIEKLVRHFKNDDRIAFVSISLDKNRAAWEQKLSADKPDWQQFILSDAFEAQLCKEYDINAIPRFLFFDKEGRIISLNAPRPSSEHIIKYLESNI